MSEALLSREEWENLVTRIDKLTLNPHERATKVWGLVQQKLGTDIDSWDMMCFCAWFLAFMMPTLPDLQEYSRMLNVKIHQVHYQGDMWKNTNVIRNLNSDSEEGYRPFGNNSPE